MKESIEHGTLPEIFTIRKSDNYYELCFGHHRQEAIIRKKNKNHKVLGHVVERTDEQMIIDMARENLTQRSDDFREERDTVLFVKGYLSDKQPSVMHHDKRGKFQKGVKNISHGIGARQIAEFLSKNGKVVFWLGIGCIVSLVMSNGLTTL